MPLQGLQENHQLLHGDIPHLEGSHLARGPDAATLLPFGELYGPVSAKILVNELVNPSSQKSIAHCP